MTDADLMAQHRHNLPDWLAKALRDQVGGEFDELVASLNQPAPLDLRVNLLKVKREAALDSLRQAGLVAEPTPFSPLGIACRASHRWPRCRLSCKERWRCRMKARNC